jgi:hypothetical protein
VVAPPGLFETLIDDAAMFPPGNAEVGSAAAEHRRYRRSWFSSLIGPLVVPDQKLAALGRAVRPAHESGGDPATIAVSVVNTGGAGGLLSLAGREVPGIRMVAVESALRDLDDLAGNAARVVSAAAELDDAVRVFVEIPYAPGWEEAVAEVEAAGLCGKIRTGGPDALDTPPAVQLARQLSVLIEADLPFKATAGLHHAVASAGPEPGRPRQHGFLNLLLAIQALVNGAPEIEAVTLLLQNDPRVLVDEISSWTDTQASRARRRLRSFGCCGVTDPVGDLVALGLVSEPP